MFAIAFKTRLKPKLSKHRVKKSAQGQRKWSFIYTELQNWTLLSGQSRIQTF